MADLLDIRQLGDRVLRETAQPIHNPQTEDIQTFVDNLIHTLRLSNGVGIAAPQVGVSERVFIVASRPNPRYPNAPEMEPTAMINPRLLSYSDEIVKDWEGCLSIPGIRGLVPRYQAIAVEYVDRDGNLRQQELTDFVARIFQHELDHLDGLVFLDRLETNHDIITDLEYLKRITQPS